MRTIKPVYYDKFQCIAGDCSFTCCQEWEIAVDANTQKRWSKMGLPLKKYLHSSWSGDCMKLEKDGRCPFLQEDKLCQLVVQYGEGVLSKTCHTFPREEHVFTDRKEYTLTMGCPAALELLWGEEQFALLETQEDGDRELTKYEGELAEEEVILLAFRQQLMNLIQNPEYSIEESLRIAFFIALDLRGQVHDTMEWLEAQFATSHLQEMKLAMDQVPREAYDSIMEQNELFLDLAQNYREKKIYSRILEPLAQLAETYENLDLMGVFLKERESFEKLWRQRDRQLRLLFAEEVYSTLYLPGGDRYSLLLKLEWLAVFYGTFKQGLFLTWKMKGNLEEGALEKTLIMLLRMTGYSEADLEEYLENSFENPVWEWGYLALIV